MLVLDPVDAASAGAIVNRAKQSDIPVVSYDRLITDADDYYISFDNEKVGKLQGESLVGKLEEDGAKGSVRRPGQAINEGAHSVIDGSPFKVAKEYDTPDWSPDKAQQEMEQAITAVGKDGFVGVYAANDGTAGGAIAAMKGNGGSIHHPGPVGRLRLASCAGSSGSSRRAVHDRLQGDQGRGGGRGRAGHCPEGAPAASPNGEIDNGLESVPSVLLEPVAVTVDNINDTIIKDQFWSVDEICAGKYAPLQGGGYPVAG